MMEHGWCLRWDPWLIGLHFLGDFAIWVAYISIPLTLTLVARQVPVEAKARVVYGWIARGRTPPSLRQALHWSAAFIVSCGFTHAVDIWVVIMPAYWFQAWVKLATGAVSLWTAYLLIVLVSDIARAATGDEG